MMTRVIVTHTMGVMVTHSRDIVTYIGSNGDTQGVMVSHKWGNANTHGYWWHTQGVMVTHTEVLVTHTRGNSDT